MREDSTMVIFDDLHEKVLPLHEENLSGTSRLAVVRLGVIAMICSAHVIRHRVLHARLSLLRVAISV